MSNAELTLLSTLQSFQVAKTADLPLLADTTLSPATIGRIAKAMTDRKQARYVVLGQHRAIATIKASTASAPSQAHALQRSMLWAALISDGYSVDNGDRARTAHRQHLSARTDRPDHGANFRRLADEWIRNLPTKGPELPYDIAWKGPPEAPTDLKLVMVLAPRVSLKKQLEALPLRILGLPRVSVILRVPEDGTDVDRLTGAMRYQGPRTRALLLAFREHKNPGAFPYWETATVDASYRPGLWVTAWSST